MSDSTDAAALRLELAELKLRIDGIEVRIAAAELKQLNDHNSLMARWSDISQGLGAVSRTMANIAGQVTASHYSLVHLLAVTARQVNVPDADLAEAMRMATKAMEPLR